MKSSSRWCLAVCLVSGALVAQNTDSVYFSTRFTETPTSGRGGTINSLTAPCNPPQLGGQFIIESAIANSPGISFVHPGVLNATIPYMAPAQQVTDYVEVANFPQINLIIGDLNGNGIPNETSNFSGVDAMYIPTASVGRPNHIHEIFISPFSDSVGNQGFIQANITEADMVLLPGATNLYPLPSTPTPPVFFIRQPHWEAFFGLTAPNNGIDVNAFTVDAASGDIYASFDADITGATMLLTPGGNPTVVTITRGDIVRVPGIAYTPSGLYGIVTNPQPMLAEVIYNQVDVTNMVTAAGGLISGLSATTCPVPTPCPVSMTNVYGLDLDPNGGTSTSPGGFVSPNLVFTVFSQGGSAGGPQNSTATAIYTTVGGGQFAVINGVTMNGPMAVGMQTTSFNPSFYAGPLDALAVVTHTPSLDPLADRPLHLDTFPTSGLGIGSPNALTNFFTGYVSGAAPGALVAIFARADYLPAGGFVDRYNLSNSGFGGFPDLYVDVGGFNGLSCVIAPALFAPFCQTAFASLLNGGNNPILVFTDPVNGSQNGDACFEVAIGGGIPVSVPPLLVTFQALDLTNVRLSDPLPALFN